MSSDPFEDKIETLKEIEQFENILFEERRKNGLPVKELQVRLSNGNIYIEVIAEKEKFGQDILDTVSVEEYSHINELKLQTYASRERVKCVYVIYDYELKKFKFKNTAKVNTIEDLSKFDTLPTLS